MIQLIFWLLLIPALVLGQSRKGLKMKTKPMTMMSKKGHSKSSFSDNSTKVVCTCDMPDAMVECSYQD